MAAPLETIRSMLDDWNGGDIEAWLARFDPDCEVRFRPQVPEPGPFHGRDELRTWAEEFRGAMGSGHVELADVLADSPDAIVVVFQFHATGAGSGVPIDLRWANVFEFSDGMIARWHDYDDPTDALKAAGFSG